MWRLLRLLRHATWHALKHDQFGIAKAAAYSAVLTLFPGLLLIASILAASQRTEAFLPEIAAAVGRILPPGAGSTAQAYFQRTTEQPIPLLISASLVALWTSSGVLVSWMEGFRKAYGFPTAWGLVKERFIAFGLVIMAGVPLTFATVLVAFGNQIESWAIFHGGHEFGHSILLIWTSLRWLIAIVTSISLMLVVYHFAVPRTLAWHSVLPGAALTTAVWFPVTYLFGWYVSRYTEYSLLYGSLATAIVLLIWMYILSVIVLIGAEFNALIFPRGAAKSAAVEGASVVETS